MRFKGKERLTRQGLCAMGRSWVLLCVTVKLLEGLNAKETDTMCFKNTTDHWVENGLRGKSRCTKTWQVREQQWRW